MNLFNTLFKHHDTKLHNLYGPTEATVDETSFECTGYKGDVISIGKPIENTCIYILDKYNWLLPEGIEGKSVSA